VVSRSTSSNAADGRTIWTPAFTKLTSICVQSSQRVQEISEQFSFTGTQSSAIYENSVAVQSRMALSIASPGLAMKGTSSLGSQLFLGSQDQSAISTSPRQARQRALIGSRKRVVKAEAAAMHGPVTAAATVAPTKEGLKVRVPSSLEYNEVMKRQMANPYEYHHEFGMNYTRITANLVVGSQPQSPEDIDALADDGVGVILNLQEDKDVAYWKVNLPAIQKRCHELGFEYHRRPAIDFDPNSLRRELPRMVAVIAKAVEAGKTVYVHCTAGLGRSPAAAIAYLYWFSEPKMDLQKAYDFLTSRRPCGPKWEAIRGATYDLAKNSPYQPAFELLPKHAFNDVADWERTLIRDRVRWMQ
jgi:protein tyrosine phosphatase (PTP) superfamily phosphohydrolase (DUF442 family)